MRIDLLIKKIRNKNKFKRLTSFGHNLRVGHNSSCYADGIGNITIGDNCEIQGCLYSMGDGKIQIGNHSVIFHQSKVGSVNRISIGNCVVISNHVHIYDNNNHPTDPQIRHKMCLSGFYGDLWKWQHSESSPVVIEDDVWIGEYATILKGVTVGKGSVVGCHSVVTKDVPRYSIVAGNPARVVKKIPHMEYE